MNSKTIFVLAPIIFLMISFQTGHALVLSPPATVVAIGGAPDGVIVDTITGNVYVTDIVTNNVTIISGATNNPIGTVQIQTSSGGGDFDPTNHEIYVTNSAASTVSAINDTSNAVVATISVGLHPGRAVFDSINQEVYVSDFAQSAVSVIDTKTNSVVATIPVSAGPAGLAFDPNNNEIYVADFSSNAVSIINGSTNNVLTTLSVYGAPDGAAFDSATGDIYISDYGSNSVTTIATATNTINTSVSVGTSPEYLVYASNNHEVYVTNRYSNSVTVLFGSPPVTVDTIPVGANPRGLGFDPNNGEVYVADNGAGTVSIIQALVPTIQLNPATGPIGTKVVALGTNIPATSVEVTFDDVFQGIIPVSNSTFSFTLDIPQAQMGRHLIKAVDQFGNVVASAQFIVSPTLPMSLGLTVAVGSIYFPGDTVVATMLVTSGGVPVSSPTLQLRVNLTKPDASNLSLNVTSIGSGLFKATYLLPKSAQIGTYSLEAVANGGALGSGSNLATFEVKLPWLSSQSSTLAVAGVVSTAALALGLVSWRKGLFRRPRYDTNWNA